MKHTLADEEARLAEKLAKFVTPRYVSPFSIMLSAVWKTLTTAPYGRSLHLLNRRSPQK